MRTMVKTPPPGAIRGAAFGVWGGENEATLGIAGESLRVETLVRRKEYSAMEPGEPEGRAADGIRRSRLSGVGHMMDWKHPFRT